MLFEKFESFYWYASLLRRVASSLRKVSIIGQLKIEIYHGSSVVNNVCTSSRIYFPMSE